MQECRAAGVAALIAVVAFLGPAAAALAADPCLRAAAVGGGDGLSLTEPVAGSRDIRLAGILAPDAGAVGDDARGALANAVNGRCLVLDPVRPAADRYGRLVVGVRRDDGLLLQDELVRRGLARVLPGLGDGALAASLLADEDAARRAGLGLWADARYRVRTAETVAADVGGYQLVEGRVVRAMRVGPRLYLNFGEDWQTDFTVVIAARALPRFTAAGIDPEGLGGRTVRVRGVVEDLNGPLIEIDEPAALEVLDHG